MSCIRRILATVTLLLTVIAIPSPAEAQQADRWEFSLSPMYFWMSELDGRMSAGPVSVPILLEFSEAADNLGGVFSFHFEARRGRWGVLTDLNFIKLASSSDFTVGPQGGVAVTGDFELDNIMFEAGVMYFLGETRRAGVIGGIRTYTLAPKISFSGPSGGATPVDGSETSTDAFAGVVFRPKLGDKWTLLSRADIGGGTADFTWSAMLAIEYRFKPWGSLDFGYKGLGIDVKKSGDVVREYDATHYGPILGFSVHWGGR